MGEYAPKEVFSYNVQWHDGGQPGEKDADSFCEQVIAQLKRRVLAALAIQEHGRPQQRVVDFTQQLAATFVGRESEEAKILGYLNAPDHAIAPYFIIGQSGIGKSSLMAHVVQSAQHMNGQAVIAPIFIDALPDIAQTRSLLEHLLDHVYRAYGLDIAELPIGEQDLKDEFRAILTHATAQRPLWFFIDALDQLQNGGQDLGWIPKSLPPHARIVMSILVDTRTGEKASEAKTPETTRKDLLITFPQATCDTLRGLTHEQGDALLTAWLNLAHRTVQPAQRDSILTGFKAANGLPLYLRLASLQAQSWSSATTPPVLSSSLEGLLKNFFNHIIRQARHNPLLVRFTLG